MTAYTRPQRAGAAAAIIGLGLAGGLPAAIAGQGLAVGQGGSPVDAEALQVLADVVLVESRCGTLNVDYGKLFAYAEAHGIRPVDIMPTGERRAAFDAATRKRIDDLPPARLCSDLAADRDAVIPGIFTAR